MRSTIFDGLQGSFGGPGGLVGVQRGQGACWEGLGGSQGGSGGVLGGPRKTSFSFLEVNFSMVQRNLDVFSLGSCCEAAGGHQIMFLFIVFRSL